MAKLESMPLLPLEKIVKRLSIIEKTALIEAVSGNKKLKQQLECLKIKRKKYCTFCILGLGMNYESLNCGPNKLSIGEQLLNSSSGDLNWKWTEEIHGQKLKETNENFDHEILIRMYGDDRAINVFDLLDLHENDTYSKQKLQIVLNEFRLVYFHGEPAKKVRKGFATMPDLFEHILTEHDDWLNLNPNMEKDKFYLRSLLNELSNTENHVIQIDRNFGTFNRMRSIQSIFIYILSNFKLFNNIHEEALKLPILSDTDCNFFK